MVPAGKTEYREVKVGRWVDVVENEWETFFSYFNFVSGIGTWSSLRMRMEGEVLEFLKEKMRCKMVI